VSGTTLRCPSSQSTGPIMAISAPNSPRRKLIEASGVPCTIIRATQFMEFLLGIADSSADGNIVRLPPVLFQPIAADDAAAIVSDVALAAPKSGIVEIAGPERAPFNEIVARYLRRSATRARSYATPVIMISQWWVIRPIRVRADLGRRRGARPATDATHRNAAAGQGPRAGEKTLRDATGRATKAFYPALSICDLIFSVFKMTSYGDSLLVSRASRRYEARSRKLSP